MCRTGLRHCRHNRTAAQRALENAQRRITRNTAKAAAARETGDQAKAAAYDALVSAATAEAAQLTAATDLPTEASPFSEDLRMQYLHGDCHLLAQELARQNPGWSVVVVGTAHPEFDDEDPNDPDTTWDAETIQHAWARRPDGALVDIAGVHPADAAARLAEQRGQTLFEHTDTDEAERVWGYSEWTAFDDGEGFVAPADEVAAEVTRIYASAAIGSHPTTRDASSHSPTAEPVEVYDSSGDPVEVIPGVIDDNADWVYRNGQCLALAVAAAEETGWPVHLRTFTDGDPADPTGTYLNLRHAYLEAPDGTLIDIRGDHDPVIVEEETRDFDGDLYAPPRTVPATEARALLEEFEGFLNDQDTQTAKSFVYPMLEQAGY